MNDRRDPGCEQTPPEIGGYFGFDLPCHPELYPDAIRFQSGRAAIRAVIEGASIRKMLLPAYVCDSVIKAVADAGAAAEFYALDEALYPKDLPHPLPEHSAVLYVDYFGLCRNNVRRLLGENPGNSLIIDNSQALFAPHEDVLATIYSPRKFAGVPDGGLLTTAPSLNVAVPEEEDRASLERMRSLLLRMAYCAREGYADFQQIAVSLKDTTPLRMSRLTRRLMQSIAWEQVGKKRRENFRAIAQKLDAINDTQWTLGEQDVPMCYPLTLRGCAAKQIRDELLARNIFVPVYWQDALPRVSAGTVEATLLYNTFFLPIDQRMERAQVESLGDLVLQLAGRG